MKPFPALLSLIGMALFAVALAVPGCDAGAPAVRDALRDAVRHANDTRKTPPRPPVIRPNAWTRLEPGLDIGVFDSPAADGAVTVVRANPDRFSLDILAAAEHESQSRTAREWAGEFDLAATINAGMFMDDQITSVGYMKHNGAVLSGRVVTSYRAALAFGPDDPSLPAVQVIDADCQNYPALRERYANVVQSLRMIDCRGANVWEPRDKRHSQAAAGVDASGNILFAFVREPHSVHEFIEALRALPLDIRNTMYLEGGAQTSLFVSSGALALERVGVSDLFANTSAWPIPNVLGLRRKSSARGASPSARSNP